MKVNLNVIPLFKGHKPELSQGEKLEFLRGKYQKEMAAEDAEDKGVNIPCFLRAETRLNNVLASGMVDKEYNKYKRNEVQNG